MANLAAKDRTRSPRYPSYALEDAIGHAEKIYTGVHRSPVDSNTAYRMMGFSGKSGASAKALGSMRQFGLIDGIGDNTRISDLALKILEPASQGERVGAILAAAMEPGVFKSVSDRFTGKIPSVDEPIRAFLIRDLGFSKSGADECIAALRKTLAYAHAFGLETDTIDNSANANASPAAVGGDKNPAPERESQLTVQANESGANEFMRVRLSKDCTVELRFEGKVESKALDNLMRYIELQKEVWLED
jgi:hypothetical protein